MITTKMNFITKLIIISVLLSGCGELSVGIESPELSRIPITTSIASTSGTELTFIEYTNSEVGFSIMYPSDWQEEDLPDENEGQRHHIALTGPEGGVELIWGTGLGGACPEGYESMTVAKGSWPACHSQKDDGTDLWSLAGKPIGDTNFTGFVFTNDTTANSRAVVLQVVSTLSFP